MIYSVAVSYFYRPGAGYEFAALTDGNRDFRAWVDDRRHIRLTDADRAKLRKLRDDYAAGTDPENLEIIETLIEKGEWKAYL